MIYDNSVVRRSFQGRALRILTLLLCRSTSLRYVCCRAEERAKNGPHQDWAGFPGPHSGVRPMLSSRYCLISCACVLAWPANAAIFSFEFAFPIAGIPEIPGSTLLASNQFVTTEVRVPNSTRLSLYRLRQSNADNLLGGFAPPGADVDLVLGSNRFEIDDQAFDFGGQLIASFDHEGGFRDALGLVFDDGGDIFTYYPDLPFDFYVDATATYDGIGPFVGSSDVIYFTVLPGSANGFLGAGLYRIEAAAIPEPASWALMIAGFGLVGAASRRRVHVTATYS